MDGSLRSTCVEAKMVVVVVKQVIDGQVMFPKGSATMT